MIRRNYPLENTENNKKKTDSTRDFTRIRKAAKPFWQEFLPRPENDSARGLVFTASGSAITADLSYEEPKKHVLLMIRLRPSNDLTPLQEKAIKKVQNESQGLSSVAFDEEMRMLRIRSQSMLPAAILANVVVPHVIKDAVTMLEDESLKDIIEQSVSY
jgi:hypothetical protein